MVPFAQRTSPLVLGVSLLAQVGRGKAPADRSPINIGSRFHDPHLHPPASKTATLRDTQNPRAALRHADNLTL